MHCKYCTFNIECLSILYTVQYSIFQLFSNDDDVFKFQAYEKKFVLKVQNRHTLAKKHFSRLPNMADHMKSRAVSEASRAPSILGKGLTSAQAARA